GRGCGKGCGVVGWHWGWMGLAGRGVRPTPMGDSGFGGAVSLGHGGDGVGHTGIPQEPDLAVLDQVAAVDEVPRLAHVLSRRPARNVASDTLPAIQDVKALDP